MESRVVALNMAPAPLLQVDGLEVRFSLGNKGVEAVRDVSLHIAEGEILGLVGESGAGKSVTGLSILGLLPVGTGHLEARAISYFGRTPEGEDLARLSNSALRSVRGKEIGMIFQEPGTALNPVAKVGRQIMDVLRLHTGLGKAAARRRAIELLDEVGVQEPQRRVDSYANELSGGQKQRVTLAMALSCNPRLLIADEPTTALDVTIQAHILELLRTLCNKRGMAMLFITHDLGVIAEMADRVAVMYQGQIVEQASVLKLFGNPQHAYTKALLACRPRFDSTTRRLPTIAEFSRGGDSVGSTVEDLGRNREMDPGLVALSGRTPSEDAGPLRLLHSRARLAELGYDASALRDTDARFVEQGAEPLVTVQGLQVHFAMRRGQSQRSAERLRAVDDIHFEIFEGQTLGLVGESGCGKTTTGLALLRLIPWTTGSVRLRGQEIGQWKGAALLALRRSMQVVLQDPFASLDPRQSVSALLTEAMVVHGLGASRAERLERAAALLAEVGLGSDYLARYPHALSGGQRQRVSIARALAVEPEFLVLDEAVSALDVSVQAQVLNLLKDLQEDRRLTYLFIGHDLSVVRFMADMVAVLEEGQMVEYGPADLVFTEPRHAHTRKLIRSIPDDSLEAIAARTGT